MNLNLNRNLTPKFYPILPENLRLDMLKPEVIRLNNGLPVYIFSGGSQDIVKIEFVFDAGSSFQRKSFTALFTNRLLTEGTRSYNASQIAEIIDFHGTFIEKNVDVDQAFVSLISPNKHLEKLLPVFEEIIKYPRFPEEEISIHLKRIQQEHKMSMEKVGTIARIRFREMLFGETHPYGIYNDITLTESIDKNELIDFHRKFYNSENVIIFLSGNPDENVIQMLNQYFGKNDWKGRKAELNQHFPELPANIHKKHIVREDAVQDAIRIGKVIFNRSEKDFIVLDILTKILGGYFGSRLMMNIREDKGYTYGIGSGLVSFRHHGIFFISTESGVEFRENVKEEIYKEIEILRNELIPEEELELVKNLMQGEFLRSIDGPFESAEISRTLLLNNLTTDYIEQHLNTLKYITAEEIRLMAQKNLSIESFHELTVGK